MRAAIEAASSTAPRPRQPVGLAHLQVAATAREVEEEEEEDEKKGGEVVAAAAAVPRSGQKRRLPPSHNILGRAVEIVGTAPTTFCIIDRHPCPCIPPTGYVSIKCTWEVQIDATEYASNPKGIVNLLGRSYGTTMDLLRILFLMGYLVNKTLAPRTELAQGDGDGESKERPHKVTVPSDSRMCITFERVPHKDNPNQFVCYRWRFREYGPSHTPSMINHLVSLMGENAARKQKPVQFKPRGGGAPDAPYMPSNMYIADWIRLCEFHRPSIRVDKLKQFKLGENQQTEPSNIFRPDDPYHPANAFNIKENLEVAARMDADPRYCDPAIYLAEDGYRGRLQQWAEGGKNVWQISPDSLAVEKLSDMHMPFQKQSPLGMLPQRKRWARLHCIPPELEQELFDATRNNSTRLSEENDIEALAKRNETERAELLFKHRKNKQSLVAARGGTHNDVDDAYHSELLALQSGKWESAFQEIFHAQGNVPPAIQRICEDMEGYLSINNDQMSIPQGQLFRNLTRFANQRVTEAIAFNEIMTVATEHQSCILFIYSALHVYSRVLLQCHHLMLGPPGIGKSFALLMLEQLLIPDTFRKYSYITPKGLAIPGKSQASLVMIIEDGQPSLLGVTGGSGGKKGGAGGACSDIEALMKQFLTSTTITLMTVVMDPKRAGEFVKCETGCIMFVAMNDSSNLFPKAILDRFCVTLGAAECNSKSSDAATRLMAMSERDASAVIKNVKLELKLWYNRKQMLHAYILHKETVGQLHPIDTSVADYVFGIMANFAETRGLRMTTQRNVVRFRDLVRSFVVTNAIDLVWDSPQAPFRDVPFEMTHLLGVNKHLFSTVEIAVFVIGLLARMWQDNAYADLLTTMKRLWFKNDAGRIEQYHNMSALNSDGSDPNIQGLERPVMPEGYHQRFRPAMAALPAIESKAKKQRKGAAAVAAAAASSSQPRIDSAYARDKEKEFADYEEKLLFYETQVRELSNWGHMTARFGIEVPPFIQLGHSQPKVDEIIEHLATKIGPEMEKRYLPTEIRAKLTEMTTTPVTVQRQKVRLAAHDIENLMGEDPEDIPDRTCLFHDDRAQLIIEHDCIRLAIPSLQHANSSKDVVLECLKEALTVLYGSALSAHDEKVAKGKPVGAIDPHAYSHFLYGETEKESDRRYIWRTIRISEHDARRVDIAKHARVFNSSYSGPMTQRVMAGFLCSMDIAYVDPAVLFRLYDSERPYTIVNTNPDELCALQRAEALGLSADDQHKVLPSNDPSVYNRAFKEHYAHQTSYIYPDDFSTHDAAFWKNEMLVNPDQFNASNIKDKLLASQAGRPSIYRRDAPLPAEAMPALESPMGQMERSVAAVSSGVADMDISHSQDGFDADEEEAARDNEEEEDYDDIGDEGF